MTEAERVIQAWLDENPGDSLARQVLADELDGDPRADGYRAMGVLGKYPLHEGNWWWAFPGSSRPEHARLPITWNSEVVHNGRWQGGTRKDVEDNAALAFAHLPEDVRARILEGAVRGDLPYQCQTCNGSGMPGGVSGYKCPECG